MQIDARRRARRSAIAPLVVLALASAAATAKTSECDGARPGAVLVVPLTPPFDPRPYPTFGFMFHGDDGRTYASTAGHVALGLDGGERTWPSGQGIVVSDLAGRRVGEIVYAIDTRTAPTVGLPPGADLALIRVDVARPVSIEVCGIGGPRGTDDRIVAPTVPVHHRWFGAAFPIGRLGQPLPQEGPWLVPARSGVSAGMPSAHTVSVTGPAFFGDSGAPVLTEAGLAVGWISGPPRSSEETAQGGTSVVSRITPAVERAGQVLGISLTLATVQG